MSVLPIFLTGDKKKSMRAWERGEEDKLSDRGQHRPVQECSGDKK